MGPRHFWRPVWRSVYAFGRGQFGARALYGAAPGRRDQPGVRDRGAASPERPPGMGLELLVMMLRPSANNHLAEALADQAGGASERGAPREVPSARRLARVFRSPHAPCPP